MTKIYLIFIEYFDDTPEKVVGYCKTEEAAIKWMDQNRPKKDHRSGYQYWYEECESLDGDIQ